ncbi:MAG: dihydrodipicolinate synthase family protein [Gemmatimonadales bacterium]
MTVRPHGLLVPITTPFDSATGDVAPVDLRENARSLVAAGVQGIVAAGSTGEAALLSEDEYRQVVAWLRDVVPDGRWLIAGAGRESTRAAVEAARVAAQEGADAVLVRSPSYYAPSITQQALTTHFRTVADESPLPLLLYNMPKYTHLPIAESVVTALADHENVWGAKDSSGDLKSFAAYREAAPGWTMFMGSGALYYAALEMGAQGAVAAAGCFAAGPLLRIGERFLAGDKAGAGAAQEMVAPLHREIVGRLGVPGIKAAMDRVGLIGGPPRPPLPELTARDRDRVAKLLAKAGLLAD